MKASVLLIVFNRPGSTREVFETVRQARPTRLYVAADGPRDGRDGEAALCEEARCIATAVDWPCQLTTLFRDTNAGCKAAVSEAISWFFEHEPEGIILEDDCVPDSSFYRYCEELLDRYRDDPRVMTIGGNYFGNARIAPFATSYFFSRHVEIWGWASWRRAWALYDRNMADWPRLRDSGWLASIGEGVSGFERNWINTFAPVHAGRVNTWDVQWVFSVWRSGGLSVLPTKNLVANIGFNENATHTKEDDQFYSRVQRERMLFPLRHPSSVARDAVLDRWLDRHLHQIGLPIHAKVVKRLRGWLKRMTKLSDRRRNA